jgi:energy-coupling factor transporter ATP-binding protein EcfA2
MLDLNFIKENRELVQSTIEARNMKVDLKYCNNIVEGRITIEDNKLNILYGINGIGKSTIAKSIYYSIHEPEKVDLLKPFSTIKDASIKSSIVFDVLPNKVIIYNDDYIKQYLFISSDEILKNSFELFIAPNDLDEQKKYINTQLELINKLLSQNKHLGQLNSLVQQLDPLFKFKKNSETELTPKSKIKQLFDEGNKVHNIPVSLIKFKNYIDDPQSIRWVDWHSKGHPFIVKKENCPFCAKILNDQERKDNSEVDLLFPKAILDVYKKIETSFAQNYELFSQTTFEDFDKITKSTSEINIENQNKLIGLYKEAQRLILQMSYSSKYTYDIFKEIENIGLELENKKIDLSNLKFIDGKEIRKVIVVKGKLVNIVLC